MGRPKKEQPNHASGMYEVKVTIGHDFDGKLIRKSFYSAISKADARAKAEEYKINQAVYEKTGENLNKTPSFKKIALEFLDIKKGTIKNSTYDFTYYSPATKFLIPYFGEREISCIRKNDIELYLKKTKQKNGFSAETIRKHYICLNQIFKNAYENGLISRNPCEGIKIASPQKSAKRTYTAEECSMVLEYCHYHKYGLGVFLMLSYGISRSELLGITWDDIDFTNNLLEINRGVVEARNPDTGKTELIIGTPKNQFRQRIIPVDVATIRHLKEQHINAPDSQYVISNKIGTVCSPSTWHERHYKQFMKDMHIYHEQHGIDIPELNPHELRHTRTSLWVNDDVNLYAVASVMGWADLKMLRKRYAHPDTEKIRAAITQK